MALTVGLHYAYGIFLVAFLEARPFIASRAALSGVGSLSTGLMLLGAAFSGALQSRIGAQRTVLFGAVVASAGLALSAAATQLWHLYAAFGVLVGIGHSLTFPPCPASDAGASFGQKNKGGLSLLHVLFRF